MRRIVPSVVRVTQYGIWNKTQSHTFHQIIPVVTQQAPEKNHLIKSPYITTQRLFSQKKGLSEHFSRWGGKSQKEESPHNIEAIVDQVHSVNKTASNALVESTENLNKTHLRTINNINNALKQNKFLIFTRPDREKQQMVFKELRKIRDYYLKIVESKQYSIIKESLINAMSTAEMSIASLDDKISQLNDMVRDIRADIQSLSTSEKLKRQALNTQLEQRMMSVTLLENLKKQINKLPEQVKLSQENAERFFEAIELNAEVLVTTCQTYGLIMQIQGAVDTLKVLNNMNKEIEDIQKSWKSVNQIIGIIAEGVSRDIQRTTIKPDANFIEHEDTSNKLTIK